MAIHEEMNLEDCVDELKRHVRAANKLGLEIMAVRPQVLARVLDDYFEMRKEVGDGSAPVHTR